MMKAFEDNVNSFCQSRELCENCVDSVLIERREGCERNSHLRITSSDVHTQKDPRLFVVPQHPQLAEAKLERIGVGHDVPEGGFEAGSLVLAHVKRATERDVQLELGLLERWN